jgi:hypothetical protein
VHAGTGPNDLADLAEVTRLAGRPLRDWSEEDEWPEWESLSYVARSAFDQVAGTDEGIYDALELRGHQSPYDPDLSGTPWKHGDSQVGVRLPKLSRLFPGAVEQRDEVRSRPSATTADLRHRPDDGGVRG